jgi:predicted PurR-regulated permease PerM
MSGPPMSGPPYGAPASGVPAWSSSAGVPSGPAALVAARRSRAVPVLIVVAALLGVILLVVTGVGLTAVSGLRRDSADLTSQRDQRKQAYADAEASLQAKFKAADLATKLARVKDLDKGTDEAFQKWNNVTGTTLGSLVAAMQLCNDAVVAYDLSVAAFPVAMLGGLPERINLDNPETDCGRAFTSKI